MVSKACLLLHSQEGRKGKKGGSLGQLTGKSFWLSVVLLQQQPKLPLPFQIRLLKQENLHENTRVCVDVHLKDRSSAGNKHISWAFTQRNPHFWMLVYVSPYCPPYSNPDLNTWHTKDEPQAKRTTSRPHLVQHPNSNSNPLDGVKVLSSPLCSTGTLPLNKKQLSFCLGYWWTSPAPWAYLTSARKLLHWPAGLWNSAFLAGTEHGSPSWDKWY